ncbi:Nucleoporin nup84 [Mycoemilia scoparia]|uniref:Nuclear pore complex protein n=1 Tax=Mycoemilia scoparia TaxID=417184 RepID=A0A9W8DXA5_9FUNG|nr:Nucleoporin nup84 [Mycoemilia scoparia]
MPVAQASVEDEFANAIQLESSGPFQTESAEKDLAAIFRRISESRYEHYSDKYSEYGANFDMRTSWKKERDTWNLAEQLYNERLATLADSEAMDLEGGEGDVPVTQNSQYATDFERVQALYRNNKSFREYVIVRDWLQEIIEGFHPVETRKGYWFYTHKSVKDNSKTPATTKQSKMGSLFASTPEAKLDNGELIANLDPDAPTRQKKAIALNDLEWEQSFIRTLYEYVRRGKMDDAMNLCRECDQPWRAASLRGNLCFFDPKLERPKDIPVDDLDSDQMCHGNINRKLWKVTCAALATDSRVDQYERALYSALSGRLDDLISVCETWEDFLWAYFICMIENIIEKVIEDKHGLYIPSAASEIRINPTKHPRNTNPKQIIDALHSHDNHNISTESNDPYRALQCAIILDNIDEYLQTYASSIESSANNRSETLRLTTHIILYLRDLGFTLPDDACNTILTSYIQNLISTGHRNLVALYTSKLPASIQPDIYAEFLVTINDELTTRQDFLKQADSWGIDVETVAKTTVEIIKLKHPFKCPIYGHTINVPTITLTSVSVPPQDLELIRSLEWIAYDKSMYKHLLLQTTAMARRFLLQGRINSAANLFNSLPMDFVQQEWTASSEKYDTEDPTQKEFEEYIKLVSLSDAYSIYESWATAQAQEPLVSRRGASVDREWLDWKKKIVGLTQRTVQLLKTNILESCWLDESLHSDEQSFASEQRNIELRQLRAVYIPDTLFLLYEVMFKTRHVMPANLRESFDLSQLVAKEDVGIYKELMKPTDTFPEGQLVRFLKLMRQSAREIMLLDQQNQ